MSTLRRIIDWLPRDMSLPEPEFRSRHRAMTGLLILHVPVLFAYGFFGRGFDAVPLAIELAFPIVGALLGALPMIRRSLRTFAVTTGLIYSSVVLLHLSGGAAESSLHFLIVLAFVFLYREWFLFLWAILLMGFSYKLLELTQGALGDAMVTTGTPEMALWALMTAASLASIGLILAWKSAADSQAATIAALETARERDEAAARRDAYGKMYVNLARRSQSLVDRQLSVIDQLEQDVNDPDILSAVFELDHLTTRIRRHGESLLVVADVDLPTRNTAPVPLTDIVRGAQSEIEQYRRVDSRIDPSIAVAGVATRDLVHLLAELLDNATSYSPPNTTVKVHARAGDAGSVVLTIEDHGLGLTPERLAQCNSDLQDTDAIDENSIRHLGLRVVARLATKHGITVRLTSTNGGGVTAWVEVPATVVASADTSTLAPARLPSPPLAAVPDAPAESPVAPLSAVPDAPTAPTAPTAAPTSPAAPSTPFPPPMVDAPPASTPAPPPAVEAPAAQAPAAEAPAAEAPAAEAPAFDAPDTAAAAPVAPAPMGAGFSANGLRRRGFRARTPVAKAHDRTPPPPPPTETPDVPVQDVPVQDAPVQDTPELPVRPSMTDAPSLPTRAVRMPKPPTPAPVPFDPPLNAEPAAEEAVAPEFGADGSPPLPRRERGATSRMEAKAKEEALDLFGALEDDARDSRSSLGDFQRGQESARREARG